VQLYCYFVSESSEFCRHNPLCCFSTSNTKGERIFRYRLSPETFGYTLVAFNTVINLCTYSHKRHTSRDPTVTNSRRTVFQTDNQE